MEIAALMLTMAVFGLAQWCTKCPPGSGKEAGHRGRHISSPQTNEENQGDETVTEPDWTGADWRRDLDAWMVDATGAMRKGDGRTIYPEKLALQPSKAVRIQHIQEVLLGRAGAFRANEFHLPDSVVWSIPDKEMVLMVKCVDGTHHFTSAPSLVAGFTGEGGWCETVEFQEQTTLSDAVGYCIWTKMNASVLALEAWLGRPKRCGGSYAVATYREGVE